MPTYATQEDLTDYMEGAVIDDPAATDRLLERAERDVDQLLGLYTTRDATSGLKLTVSDLEDYQAAALSRAVCAQAEYRYTMGEEFFVKGQHRSVTGPDFSVNGTLPYIGPKVWVELEGANLQRLTTSLNARGLRPPWYGFSYNDTSWDSEPDPLPRQH